MNYDYLYILNLLHIMYWNVWDNFVGVPWSVEPITYNVLKQDDGNTEKRTVILNLLHIMYWNTVDLVAGSLVLALNLLHIMYWNKVCLYWWKFKRDLNLLHIMYWNAVVFSLTEINDFWTYYI